MKPVLKKRFVFIAKSMLWSLLLYVVLMVSFNWDDLNNKIRGANAITVVNVQQAPPVTDPAVTSSKIAHNISAAEKIITLAKTIGGIIGIVTR